MIDYKDVCKRVAKCRKDSNMTQEKMGLILDMNQESYSYLENGNIKISGKNLKDFYKLGWDIDFILTGKTFNPISEDMHSTFMPFTEGSERNIAMKMMAEMMLLKLYKESESIADKDKDAILLLENIIKSWNNFSMFNYIRKKEGKTQEDMAEDIGTSVKTYRALERESRYPDAEILLHCYEQYNYQPTLYMDYYDRKLAAMGMVWNLLVTKDKEKIVDFVNTMKTTID